ncbi:LOW QUALITY PROTEIN: SANT and BTB domain regulator of class switch recombination [Drosophila sulfurigaster albostrigata]|uniref:LOW QUALITY PROTEIN: SANT and BTB domain regulator of class switch recombination n=1 Tax=Drosophila sulfurigaster albostrigata TaxID=89887 RepID=UPI002D218BDE|nr:LOW QUALITY PROTEIN: SANT and BTB domain regulator of class switch recombination [Drosophila sulfurigaster albostrigata]
MIAKADSKPHNREPVPPAESAAGVAVAKRNAKKDEFDFNSLAENPLVNELLALKRPHRHATNENSSSSSRSSLLMEHKSTARSSHVHTPRGLHPKLNEQLDYVINEGVLDSVLSFICPMPLPVAFTNSGRAKLAKQQQQQQLQQQQPLKPEASNSNAVASSKPDLGVTSSPSVSSPRESREATLDSNSSSSASNGMVRALVKEQSGKGATTNATARRKSLLLAKDSKHARQEKKEPEVVIHVCDEVKNTSRDFSCPQSLLISKMGYFADVTAGQRLEEMDISVHCDIQIFDWLMKWIKHSAQSQELAAPGQSSFAAGPQLDGNNVVPILVSASFLQMEPLLLECLAFCHAHLSEVVRTSTNLSCLNDALVSRLAAMFTNLELEMVRDKKERVTPRLWTKLIQSLCEPDAEVLRGHFYSISGLFRCVRCCRCVTNTMKSYVNCIPSNIRLNRWGQLISSHVRDTNWDLNVYVLQLFKELKSWRKVYWKLWGHCHYLYCCSCEAHFPVYQMNWCRYHPEPPNFLGPEIEGRMAGPAGRYACCNQQAFRYETLPGPNGCQFREHSVLVDTDRERAILTIAQLVGENYALCEQPPLHMQELAAAGEISPNWLGISLTPQRCRQGLLPQLCMDMTNHRVSRRCRYEIDTSTESETTSTSSEDTRSSRPRIRNTLVDDEFTSSSDGCESDHRPPPRKTRGKKKRKRPAAVSGRFWSGELSARSNQDHQRDFEEKIMKQVASYVTKKTGSDQNLVHNAQPLGGTYVRLESEWKEMLKQRHSNHNLQSGGGGNGNSNMGANNGNAALGSNSSSNQNLYSGGGATVGGMACGSGASLLSKQKHK